MAITLDQTIAQEAAELADGAGSQTFWVLTLVPA